MSTLAEREDALDHLAYNPACEGRAHQGTRPPADFWVDKHGHADLLLCTDCLDQGRRRLPGAIKCVCGQSLPSFEAATTVRPLR